MGVHGTGAKGYSGYGLLCQCTGSTGLTNGARWFWCHAVTAGQTSQPVILLLQAPPISPVIFLLHHNTLVRRLVVTSQRTKGHLVTSQHTRASCYITTYKRSSCYITTHKRSSCYITTHKVPCYITTHRRWSMTGAFFKGQ